MATEDRRRVVVGLSGGVDSGVAAALLLEAGYEVMAVALRMWRFGGGTEAPTEAATSVADALGVPLRVVDVRSRFLYEVVRPFVAAYAQGRTPNPCVFCNPTLKFATLLAEAKAAGAWWVATGHYARVRHTPQGSHLLQAISTRHDQSYMLYRLTQQQLRHLLFPLGEVTSKETVRALARDYGLPVAERASSQDLCFMGGGNYRALVQAMLPSAVRPGPILDEAGRTLGEHQGLPFYTVGQRRGLGIAAPQPLYVLHLDAKANALIVGPKTRLERDSCRLTDVTFTQGNAPASHFTAEGRIRYRAPRVPLTVEMGKEQAHVTFAEPQRGVAPGQSLVFYEGEEVLGGGVIN